VPAIEFLAERSSGPADAGRHLVANAIVVRESGVAAQRSSALRDLPHSAPLPRQPQAVVTHGRRGAPGGRAHRGDQAKLYVTVVTFTKELPASEPTRSRTRYNAGLE
jgi:hypothetical protein